MKRIVTLAAVFALVGLGMARADEPASPATGETSATTTTAKPAGAKPPAKHASSKKSTKKPEEKAPEAK